MARKKNPEIHVDINSHNFADNPAAVVDAVNRLSQRPHKTKSGAVTKKPDARLKSRRAKNTKKGFYPNPIDSKLATDFRVAIYSAIEDVTKPRKGIYRLNNLDKQARVSYAQGLIVAGFMLKVLDKAETDEYMNTLKQSYQGQK